VKGERFLPSGGYGGSSWNWQEGIGKPLTLLQSLDLWISVFFLLISCRSDALRLEQNSPDVLALRGLVLFLSAKLPQALQHVQSALRLDPGHEAAMQLRKRVKEIEKLKEEGNVAFKTGRLVEAINKYGEALEV
jgi:tetratricopeptide (TPR) repeat protein